MNCPLCLDAPLEPKFVGRTEVDICVRCRGMWLDRGELDRLLDQPAPVESGRGGRSYEEPAGRPDDDRVGGSGKKPKKKKTKAQRLADLFEEVLDL